MVLDIDQRMISIIHIAQVRQNDIGRPIHIAATATKDFQGSSQYSINTGILTVYC